MDATFDADELAKQLTLHVYIRGMAQLRRRLWVGTWLMRLACWVIGIGIEVTEIDDFAH